MSWTLKQEQYYHYEWGLGSTTPALSYKIIGDSRTSTYRHFSIMMSKIPALRVIPNALINITTRFLRDEWLGEKKG